MNLSRGLRSRFVSAAIIAVFVLTVSWLLWPFRGIALWIVLPLLPLLLLVLVAMIVPARLSPAVRLVTSVGVFSGFFILSKLLAAGALEGAIFANVVGQRLPVPTTRLASLVPALTWLAGQIVLVVLSDRARSGVAGTIATSLAERGYIALIRSASRGEFGASPALVFRGMRWGLLILTGCLLLYRSGSLDELEEDLILPVNRLASVPGSSASVVATLTTADNNPRQYLETALVLNRRFRAGGAAVVCFPSKGIPDSITRALTDSLTASGAVIYDREQFDPRYAMIGASWNFLRFRSIAFAWSNSLPTVHPSLRAAARYLNVSLRVPPEYDRFLHLNARAAGTAGPPRGEIMIGTSQVPRWDDGMSVVLRRSWFMPMQYSTGGDTLWNSFIFPANIERLRWDGPILYKEYGSGRALTTLPDSVWQFAAGRMVFIQWVNLGDGDYHDMASIPAQIADMAVRGLFVREAPAWHILVSMLVMLLGVLLFAMVRPWMACIALLACAIGLGSIDVWIFREYLLVTRLVYPMFVCLMTALVLPLVRISIQRS